jgi:TIR domain/SIR2-like domain
MAAGQQVSVQNPIASWGDRDWNRLLGLLKIRKVVPIVGAELSLGWTGADGEPVIVKLARELANRLGISAEDLPPDGALTEVAWRIKATAGSGAVTMQDLYFHLFDIVKSLPKPLSEPLRQLAQIDDLPLYITTAFDTALESAILEAHRPAPISLSYAPNDPRDIEPHWAKANRPLVYHLLGEVSPIPYSYAVTDEDTLEFFHALLTTQRRPVQLFKELAEKNLLIVGGGYSDWLARLFLRAMKGEQRLSAERTVSEFIADLRAVREPSLVLFLQHFSQPTRLYADGDPGGFVAELHRRWCEANPEKLQKRSGVGHSESTVDLPAEMPDHSIFLSYAREDGEAVKKIFNGLTERGLRVWFDRKDIRGGDNWDPKSLTAIERADLFIAVISRNTEASRGRRNFKREWNHAWDQQTAFSKNETFFCPVVIDETSPDTAHVDDYLLKVHWEPLPAGEVSESFAQYVRKLIADRSGR